MLGLVDAEYGWPTDVDLASVRTLEDVLPSPREHPFLRDGDTVVAIVVSAWEWTRIRARLRNES